MGSSEGSNPQSPSGAKQMKNKAGKKIVRQVWDQVSDQVRNQVADQMSDQMWDQVRGQMLIPLRNHLHEQTRNN